MPVTRNPRTRLALTSPRSRRIRSGMIGFSIRASSARNAAISTAASPPNPSTCEESQPCAGGLRRSRRCRSSARRSRAASRASRRHARARCPCRRGSTPGRARTSTIPIGRLTKNTQCQLSAWVSTPPASSPSEPPATDTNTYALIARARSAGLRELGDDDREDHRRLRGCADRPAGNGRRSAPPGSARFRTAATQP